MTKPITTTPLRSANTNPDTDPNARSPIAVVMAKVPVAGNVKTRLAAGNGGRGGGSDGSGADGIGDERAARVAAAMAECVIARLQNVFGRSQVIVAVSPDDAIASADASNSTTTQHPWILSLPDGVRVVPQGSGDLGQRMIRIWQSVDQPVAFFGMDSPDVPTEVLQANLHSPLAQDAGADSASWIGPTPDGGYWTLASSTYQPRLLQDISWGSESVFAETKAIASRLNVPFHELPIWNDVDTHGDLRALMGRLTTTDEPELQQLLDQLSDILA